MSRSFRRLSAARSVALCLSLVWAAAALPGGRSPTIRLPAETAVLKPSPLFGYRIAQEKCGICHSADYINLQPPAMTLTQWTAEMTKMRNAYGAPLDDAEIKDLAVYLTTVYGDAGTAKSGPP